MATSNNFIKFGEPEIREILSMPCHAMPCHGIQNGQRLGVKRFDTVTPFKFASSKVRGFDIMTYLLSFNFAVSYQNYFTVSYTN